MRRVLLAVRVAAVSICPSGRPCSTANRLTTVMPTGCSVGWIHSPTRLVIGVTSPRLASAGQHASKNGGGGVVN